MEVWETPFWRSMLVNLEGVRTTVRKWGYLVTTFTLGKREMYELSRCNLLSRLGRELRGAAACCAVEGDDWFGV